MKAEINVIHPIVHMNGTSADELIDLRSNAWDALRKALDMLKRMAPNGRDYYPEPGRMDLAHEQHDRRLRTVCNLMNELECEIDKMEYDRCS